ncbi:MAG: 30S ribosomal protein S20 [Phycisphaeraceae bacterium]|nr:30S ribosomal protein S20 [Phycisphaeraceae bacterium]
MAHSLSAKKRVRQNARRQAYNRWRKQDFRAAIRDYRELILHGTVEESQTKLDEIYKLLDRAADKGVIHKNAAARHKRRLTGLLNEKKQAA